MIEALLAILVGALVGILTGLVPGLHINLVALLVVSFSAFLLTWISPLGAALFIISMSMTHNFLDFIPSTYLAAPNPDTVEGVLPAHRMLHQGKGHEAIFLAVFGALAGVVVTAASTFILSSFIKDFYDLIEKFIPAILIGVIYILIFREKNRFSAFFCVLLAGAFGLVVLNFKHITQPLLPMLSGMFGVSALIISMKDDNKIPKQVFPRSFSFSFLRAGVSSLKGILAAVMTAFLPGLSSSHTSLLALSFSRKKSHKDLLFLVGFVNSASMVLSLIALYFIEKARNGSVIAISELLPVDKKTLLILFAGVLINCFFSTFLALKLSKAFSHLVQKISYKKICLTVIFFIVLMVFALSGVFGMAILIISTFLGFIPLLSNVSRNHLMASLIIPVVFYFLL